MGSILWGCEGEFVSSVVVYNVSVTLCLLSCDGVDVEN